MNFNLKFYVLISALSLIQSHTHDEISKCSLTGVHKTRQTIIESPNYPNNYKPDTCWDYVIRSPYKCPTKFHIQFLDFYLEFSKDCKNDYLAIGLENVDDDMDVLCGQVVGIKRYHTPDGVLRLRFFTDESPWTTGKGFKLLITRLACEREELLRNLEDHNDEDDEDDLDDDDTISVSAPTGNFQLPERELMQIFRNLTGQEQYQIVTLPPVFGLNYPTLLPSPPYPSTATLHYPGSNQQSNFQPPCTNDKGQQRQSPSIPHFYGALNGNQLAPYPNTFGGNVQANYLPSYTGLNSNQKVQAQQMAIVGSSNNGFLTNPRDQYIGSWSSTPILQKAIDNSIDSLEACCVSAFQQKHFYLSSPGFPRTIFSNILPNLQKRDCVFHVQKSSANVCRLRLDFKFFDFGQSDLSTGSYVENIGTTAIQNVCRDDFIKIDNQRFCGCRSGYTFSSHWTTAADKKIRMRMGYSGIPSGGFLLELLQEECSETQLASMTTERPPFSTLTTINPNVVNDQLFNPLQTQQITLGQQQQNIYGDINPTQQQNQQQHQQQLQNLNGALYGGSYQGQPFLLQNPLQQSNYLGQQQQLLNTPGGIPNNLQQHNPLLPQQQHHLQSPQNNNFLYPSQSNYFNYLPPQNIPHNIWKQQGLGTNPFSLPQIRNTRSYSDQQPVTVVETNSTRKAYYYSDNDALSYNNDLSHISKSSSADTSFKWDRKDANVNEKYDLIGNFARQSQKCSFDMRDILRLSVDILWITKPICYAPQRNWFTNWIG